MVMVMVMVIPIPLLLALQLRQHAGPGLGPEQVQAGLAAGAAVRRSARLAGPQLVVVLGGAPLALVQVPALAVVVLPARQASVLVHHVHLLRHEDLVQALRQDRPEHRDRRADAGQVHLDRREHDALGPVPRRVRHRVRRRFGLYYRLQAPYAH